MTKTFRGYKGYLAAAALGAVGGALAAAYLTQALPRMMSELMRNMMAQMQEAGCSPSEI